MKFRKKKNPSSVAPLPVRSEEKSSFYARPAGEPPLHDIPTPSVTQRNRLTSRHSRSGQEKRNNRASHWSLFILISRALLVVVLLAGGFFALRLFTDRIVEPSDKDLQRWDANEARMTRSAAPEAEAGAPLSITPELLSARIEQWEQTGHYLRTAEALIRRGIHDQAIARLEDALRMMPENTEVLHRLADLYRQTGHLTGAARLYLRLLDQNARQPALQMDLLRLLEADGRMDAAAALAGQLLKEQPDNPEILLIAAAGQLAAGNRDTALELLERILKNDAANLHALKGCAQIHFGKGDWPAAIPYYLELSRIDSKPEWHYRIAYCFAQQMETEKSIVLMGQAVSLFGSAEVKPWLMDSGFDPVRETPEFRAFADRLVGIETRKAIEAINRREKRDVQPTEEPPDGIEIPRQPDLQVIRPGRQ